MFEYKGIPMVNIPVPAEKWICFILTPLILMVTAAVGTMEITVAESVVISMKATRTKRPNDSTSFGDYCE